MLKPVKMHKQIITWWQQAVLTTSRCSVQLRMLNQQVWFCYPHLTDAGALGSANCWGSPQDPVTHAHL